MTIYETLEPQATVAPLETTGAPIGDQGAEERGAESPFPIVGIGASAGGLEAFTQFLAHLPDQTGMAFVLVQHLDPRHESRLTEILARSTHMPVLEATDGLEVCPDRVYVIPPNTNMAIAQGALRVTPRGEAHGPHLPIDHFLRALAEAQQAQAIGVVLSGTGSDGTLGLCEIKAVGGISFAQEPESAKHGGMPSSAIDSGSVDFVLAPEEIAKRLGAIGVHPYLAPTRAMADEPGEAEDQFKRILAAVRAATEVNFSLYRDTMIRRRIMRRMALHGQQSLADYARRLEQDGTEVEALYRDLLINVTSFFRDPALFETLKNSVFPEIVKAKPPTAPLRLWVPGCSTGQEAYSLAMALFEFFDERPVRPSIQIFATDLSDAASLERARAGLYPESIEGEVSPERLRRFFKKEDHLYRIDKSIRDACVFARQNLTADPPFSHVDLISCRNVLIYMAPALQKRVLPTLHYALKIPGFLVLGSSETVGEFTTLFEVVERSHKIYAKKVTSSRPLTHFAVEDYKTMATTMATAGHRAGPLGPTPADFQKTADRLLLGRYAPPGVLVNEHFEILQFRGRTARYLEVPSGEPTLSLLQMAPQGLFLELRSALNEAKERNEAVCREGVRMRDEHGVYEVTLQVLPVEPWGAVRCYLVLFEEPGRREGAGSRVVPAAEGPDGAAPLAGWFAWLHQWVSGKASLAPAKKRAVPEGRAEAPASLPETATLRQELAATREYLQSLIEQQDAANEELRSANEEILSSNEELQSTNEELETAKEELQSTNEELSTVNEELQHRNLELNQTTNDLQNLLTSTTIPVVMVGLDLRIRRLTPPARKIMNLLSTDVGRPIADLKANVDVPDLEVLIAEVIGEVQVLEREVRDRDGRWYALRVHPYRTTDNKIDGAVVVLLDIDEIKRGQEARCQSEERLSLAVHGAGMATWDVDLKIGKALWSETHFQILGYDPIPGGEATLEMWQSRVHPDDLERVLRALEEARSERSLYAPEHRIIRADNGEVRWLSVFGRFLYDPAGEAVRFVGVMYDVTERKDMEALKEIDRCKNEFLATLAHELRNPLAAIGNAVWIMRFCGDDPAQAAETRDMLERQLRQLVRIVDDLLDVSRIVEGKIDLRKERVTLEAVVKTAVETSRSFIEASGHELTVTLPPEPVVLDADPVRLAQVLINLLNNAAKFTEAGGRIWLVGETSSENPPVPTPVLPLSPPSQGDPPIPPLHKEGVGGGVVIRVRDTGIGIPAVLLPRIFAMFTQADRSLERSRGGLGLGLTLARSLVQIHGGTIEAHSAGPGQGSEFVVRLPRAARGLEARDAGAEEGSGQEITGSPRRRILVVDDDRDVARSTETLLNLMGHDVRMTHDGPSALKAATAFVPEVALIDIGLPGMNGYEVARKMRERLQDVVLIAQTGYGQEAQRRRAQEAGFDIHLTKPVDFDQLERVLGSMPTPCGLAHEGARGDSAR